MCSSFLPILARNMKTRLKGTTNPRAAEETSTTALEGPRPSSALDEIQVPEAIVVRSLRRMLFQALHGEDRSSALQVYQATRLDWEHWKRRTQREVERQNREREQKLQENHKPFWSRRTSRKSSNPTNASPSDVFPSGPWKDSSSNNNHPRHRPKPGLLQLHMNPSEPFNVDDYRRPNDPFPDRPDWPTEQAGLPVAAAPTPSTTKRRFWASKVEPPSRHRVTLRESWEVASSDARMTTPLHEAARLGHAELVRLMLQHGDADPNAQNGLGRTALHCAAGGLTRTEAALNHPTNSDDVWIGIREPAVIDPDTELPAAVPPTSRRSNTNNGALMGAMDRLFHHNPVGMDHPMPVTVSSDPVGFAEGKANKLLVERTEAAHAILNWSHCDDGTSLAGQGPSINAVDQRGRTSLHYGAELGRTDICVALASSFGAILTIVDDRGKTPCELAAEGQHTALAAHLEARAVLYIDPDGTDDDLLAAVVSNSDGAASGQLVPPFCWFETCTMGAVQEERENRLSAAQEKLKKVVEVALDEQNSRATLCEWLCDGSSGNETNRPTKKNPAIELHNPQELKMSLVNEAMETSTANGEYGGISFASMSGEAADPVGETSSDKASGEAPPSSLNGKIHHEGMSQPELPALMRFQGLHKGHIALYLAAHKWDVQMCLMAFIEDPNEAFQVAGVSIPKMEASRMKLDSQTERLEECQICCDSFESRDSWHTLVSCGHAFCKECLGEYIESCAKSKSGLSIACPHHACNELLTPIEIDELSTTPAVRENLISMENERFVQQASEFQFCPYPSCGGIVRFRAPHYLKTTGLEASLLHTVGAVCTASHSLSRPNDLACRTYEGMLDPEYLNCRSSKPLCKAHRFCFSCGNTGFHWPVACDRLAEWRKVIKSHVLQAQEGSKENSEDNFYDVAQTLWLKTNTRPCPKVICCIDLP